ncbi:metacaspase-2-like isoform X2 [Daktulosphaira vitifoliae]|nr:metacaspase-2-like isoform X2 [Daktulosphaira vitifoliae]
MFLTKRNFNNKVNGLSLNDVFDSFGTMCSLINRATPDEYESKTIVEKLQYILDLSFVKLSMKVDKCIETDDTENLECIKEKSILKCNQFISESNTFLNVVDISSTEPSLTISFENNKNEKCSISHSTPCSNFKSKLNDITNIVTNVSPEIHNSNNITMGQQVSPISKPAEETKIYYTSPKNLNIANQLSVKKPETLLPEATSIEVIPCMLEREQREDLNNEIQIDNDDLSGKGERQPCKTIIPEIDLITPYMNDKDKKSYIIPNSAKHNIKTKNVLDESLDNMNSKNKVLDNNIKSRLRSSKKKVNNLKKSKCKQSIQTDKKSTENIDDHNILLNDNNDSSLFDNFNTKNQSDILPNNSSSLTQNLASLKSKTKYGIVNRMNDHLKFERHQLKISEVLHTSNNIDSFNSVKIPNQNKTNKVVSKIKSSNISNELIMFNDSISHDTPDDIQKPPITKSMSTPRRRSTHIRALDFSTPQPKKNAIELVRSKLFFDSPKRIQTILEESLTSPFPKLQGNWGAINGFESIIKKDTGICLNSNTKSTNEIKISELKLVKKKKSPRKNMTPKRLSNHLVNNINPIVILNNEDYAKLVLTKNNVLSQNDKLSNSLEDSLNIGSSKNSCHLSLKQNSPVKNIESIELKKSFESSSPINNKISSFYKENNFTDKNNEALKIIPADCKVYTLQQLSYNKVDLSSYISTPEIKKSTKDNIANNIITSLEQLLLSNNSIKTKENITNQANLLNQQIDNSKSTLFNTPVKPESPIKITKFPKTSNVDKKLDKIINKSQENKKYISSCSNIYLPLCSNKIHENEKNRSVSYEKLNNKNLDVSEMSSPTKLNNCQTTKLSKVQTPFKFDEPETPISKLLREHDPSNLVTPIPSTPVHNEASMETPLSKIFRETSYLNRPPISPIPSTPVNLKSNISSLSPPKEQIITNNPLVKMAGIKRRINNLKKNSIQSVSVQCNQSIPRSPSVVNKKSPTLKVKLKAIPKVKNSKSFKHKNTNAIKAQVYESVKIELFGGNDSPSSNDDELEKSMNICKSLIINKKYEEERTSGFKPIPRRKPLKNASSISDTKNNSIGNLNLELSNFSPKHSTKNHTNISNLLNDQQSKKNTMLSNTSVINDFNQKLTQVNSYQLENFKTNNIETSIKRSTTIPKRSHNNSTNNTFINYICNKDTQTEKSNKCKEDDFSIEKYFKNSIVYEIITEDDDHEVIYLSLSPMFIFLDIPSEIISQSPILPCKINNCLNDSSKTESNEMESDGDFIASSFNSSKKIMNKKRLDKHKRSRRSPSLWEDSYNCTSKYKTDKSKNSSNSYKKSYKEDSNKMKITYRLNRKHHFHSDRSQSEFRRKYQSSYKKDHHFREQETHNIDRNRRYSYRDNTNYHNIHKLKHQYERRHSSNQSYHSDVINVCKDYEYTKKATKRRYFDRSDHSQIPHKITKSEHQKLPKHVDVDDFLSKTHDRF